MGKEKAFLTYDDINQELPEGLVSPDDIEDIFATLSGEGITISDSEEKFLETAAAVATAEKKFEEPQEEELELDLTPGALDKTNDPVRLYLREMGIVPLLTREGEVTIAKRIERGQIKTRKAISRSPIAVERLIKLGDDLVKGRATIRETVAFSEQAEISLEEDKAEEYMRWTLEGIGNIQQTYNSALKSLAAFRKEQVLAKDKKKPKKLLRLRRQTARLRLEIAQEIKNLNLTEHSMQILIASIRKVAEEIRKTEKTVKTLQTKVEKT